MKISVVTVCYNSAPMIEETIRSVIGQTYPDMEYIVIDGASTDGTHDILCRYADNIDHLVSEPDKGIYDAMNKGISAASGDYIIFMNAGDHFASADILVQVAPHLGEHTIITGRWRRCYADGHTKPASPKPLKNWKVEMPICHQATFTRLSYHRSHPFDTSFRLSADYDFFYHAWREGEKFRYIDETIVDFLEAEGASTDNISVSVMEREKAWKGEKGLLFRKLNLKYQICRIKTVKFIKSLTSYSK